MCTALAKAQVDPEGLKKNQIPSFALYIKKE
jgi:hypothetical protein